MDSGGSQSLARLAKSLSAGQIWALVSAAFASFGACFTVGFSSASYLGRIQVESQAAAFEERQIHLEEELRITSARSDSAAQAQANAQLKSEFLDYYLGYALALAEGEAEETERTSKLFAGFLYRLWSEQEDAKIKYVLGSGLSGQTPAKARPRVTRSKKTKKKRRTTPIRKKTTVRRPVSADPRPELSEGKDTIKWVSFPDGSEYAIPYEIAQAVHLRE